MRGLHPALPITLSLFALLVLVTSCQETPPPLPEVLLVVDTDVNVPRTASRLRVDIFREDGTWIHSRDVPRIRATDWPASFGILSNDETRPSTVLVRLRAYPEGALRDYRGTKYEPPPKYTPPHVAEDLKELCASLEDLPPFVEKTWRRGGTKSLTTDSCRNFETPTAPYATGAVAARVTIKSSGRYRFEVVRSNPPRGIDVEPDTTIFLRRDCMNTMSELGCHDDIDGIENQLSRLILDVDPGTYTLMTGGFDGQPADLTLRWTPEAEWGPENAPAPDAFIAAPSISAPNPRLRVGGADITPTTEPLPVASIDRVVRLTLAPGRSDPVRVTLHGACAGTMAELPALDGSETQIDPSKVRTCVTDPAVFEAPAVEIVATPEIANTPSVQGSMMKDEVCQPEDSDEQVVCVPGGTFVLGGGDLDGFGEVGFPSGLPVRIAALHRFWMDKHEVTVGRYREATTKGFVDKTGEPALVNDGPIVAGSLLTSATFTKDKGVRERFPINAISWRHANAMCAFYGGSLPTEAQWEYAASSANREHRTTFPWGEAPASCDRAVIHRKQISTFTRCQSAGQSPTAVDAPDMAGDVGELGIFGLGGNMSEYTLDAKATYDSPCWSGIGPIDPMCADPNAPHHIVRGSSWAKLGAIARSVARGQYQSNTRGSDIGFRCAYPQAPARRWSVP